MCAARHSGPDPDGVGPAEPGGHALLLVFAFSHYFVFRVSAGTACDVKPTLSSLFSLCSEVLGCTALNRFDRDGFQ